VKLPVPEQSAINDSIGSFGGAIIYLVNIKAAEVSDILDSDCFLNGDSCIGVVDTDGNNSGEVIKG
jgi:hypothetical protein